MTAPRVFDALLEYLSSTRGFDFRVYKRAALIRRFEKRLEAVKVGGFDEYTDYLEVHPEEFANLFNTVLINVTSFFRDAPSWAFLREEVIPRIVGQMNAGDPIRAWSAGCASGEETYTLAMILAEALGPEQFAARVKIYASDIDADALAQARSGAYDAHRIGTVPDDLREKYFETHHHRWVFRSDLRRSVIFGRHNIVLDAPISRLDLLICRNTLMYLNAETQAQVLNRFHFALSDRGYLFLGRAEMLVTHTGLFTPLNLRHRVFSRGGKNSLRDRLLTLPHAEANGALEAAAVPSRLRDATVESASSVIMVVDVGGTLLLANSRARSMFGLVPRDVGRPFFDIAMPQSPVDLRPLIQSAYAEGPVTISGVEWKRPGQEPQHLRVIIQPVRDEAGDAAGVIISFDDLTNQHRLKAELEQAQGQLSAANEELQSTNGELETTNEELQSSNEELETTNEELQSANEELETMNEELQSTNEELQTINEELRQRTDEASRATGFLESIFAGLTAGVVVVDARLNILAWSHKAEDLWGLRNEEVRGQSILGLDIGLPLDQLRPALRAALSGDGQHEPLVLDARNRRGRMIKCRVSISPLIGDGRSRDGDGRSRDGDGRSRDGDGRSRDGDGRSRDGDGRSRDGDGRSRDGVIMIMEEWNPPNEATFQG